MQKRFFVTTPIYYVNGSPHVGTATSTLIADAVNRFQGLMGRETYFLTGTDEHAVKVARAAAAAGAAPHDFVDALAARFIDAWKLLGVRYDRFIRTTDADHKAVVSTLFERLVASGDIYTGAYTGWYSVADETYYSDDEVENGHAKETGSAVEQFSEENYYFRLSAYATRLLEQIEAIPDFLMPETRRNEVVAFIRDGLRDVPISRRNAGWGIPVPGDASQVVYVWFDALVNYLTATGWPDNPRWMSLWPADAHIVGKEIYTRFHATMWPAMLMALGLPLPLHIIGHGWWLIGGEKGSKSKGNIPTAEEAVRYLAAASGASEPMAVNALRYYLLRDISFTSDAEFSYANLTARYNGELANDLGNLLNRSLNMLAQYEGGVVPGETRAQGSWTELAPAAREAADAVEKAMTSFDPGKAIEATAVFVGAANRAIDAAAPWKRFREGERAAVREALYAALEANRLLSVLIEPIMPNAARAFRRQLGLPEALSGSWSDLTRWGALPGGVQTVRPEPLFPRIDTHATPSAAGAPGKPNARKSMEPTTASPQPQQARPAQTEPGAPLDRISIQEFARVQLRVGEIKTAERVEGATKLLRLTVDVGEAEPRQLVAGIAESYAPEDLPGRKIVVVANLQPARIRGVDSNGMLLAATDENGRAILLRPDSDVSAGAKVK